ncbi:hypothetical protein SporoP37_16565 (plasmid) [Sporosarcina sp. P37]|uniref:hypothetical protein n=1 Tax=unclassified Sporosarcina TaxID=2647733 RepID=UPI000A17E0D7|nr:MULTISPECIES: hypothetical protein [unclassified Sporosarcina]ARK26391.1 hypothetical protein SporoP37_16565 [Sporosarcina sp. P37]PID17620.1 hypothetical protein CSV62_12525 [Sporosarcina sp. P35]
MNGATADMTQLLSGIQETEVATDRIIDAVEELNKAADQLIRQKYHSSAHKRIQSKSAFKRVVNSNEKLIFLLYRVACNSEYDEVEECICRMEN